MRILQLCNKSPWPPKEGGSIAMNAITESLLRQGHQVKVIAMNTWKYPVKLIDFPEEYRDKTKIALGEVDLRIRPHKAFAHLFSRHSYVVRRFESKDFRNVLRNTLLATRFDIVILETLYLTPYIPDIRDLSDAKVVLRSHNIEHQIWKRYASNTKNPLKKLYLNILSKELEQYEKAHINDYDGILPITDVDKHFYEKHAARGLLMAHPFATNARIPENITAVKSKNSLFHLGSMDWMPNQEGILWFLNKVWPEVHSSYPQLSFSLAGRNMPSWIYKRQDAGLVVDGEVDNAYKYMQSKNIMIVPLFSGSGIRIKIVEGMLNKNVIITTSVGAEGIDCMDGEHLLIANNATEFKARIQWCMENPDEAVKLGEQAAALIQERYNLNDSSKTLDNYLNELNEQ